MNEDIIDLFFLASGAVVVLRFLLEFSGRTTLVD